MLYMQERVPVPRGWRYQPRKWGRYVYLYYVGGPMTRRKSRRWQKCMGRLTADDEGNPSLIPNEYYYTHFSKPLPGGETPEMARARERLMQTPECYTGRQQPVPDIITHLQRVLGSGD